MSPFKRWRIALPLTIISALALAATIVGAVVYWDVDSTQRNLLTVFLGVMFAACTAVSLSIGFDRGIQDVPWLRIITVVVFIALACGVSWVRDTV